MVVSLVERLGMYLPLMLWYLQVAKLHWLGDSI
jgi:hypothetical protein